jgi:hypothetical protein
MSVMDVGCDVEQTEDAFFPAGEGSAPSTTRRACASWNMCRSPPELVSGSRHPARKGEAGALQTVGAHLQTEMDADEKASFNFGGTRARPRKGIERQMLSGVTYLKPPGSCLTRWPGVGITVQVECLENSSVYVLDPCEQVQVSECENCRIVIGPCVGSALLFDCIGCTIAVAAKQTRLRDCVDCELRTFSPTSESVVIETSKKLRFGCWDIAYAGLAAQMQTSKWLQKDATKCALSLSLSLTRTRTRTRTPPRGCRPTHPRARSASPSTHLSPSASYWNKIFDFSPAAKDSGAAPNWSTLPSVDATGKWCQLTITPEGHRGGVVTETRSNEPRCACACTSPQKRSRVAP